MGRKKQNRVDRWRDEFGVVYRIGKARAGLTEENIAMRIGLQTRPPLQARRKDPGKFTLNELILMREALRFTDEDYLTIIHAGKI